MNLVVMERGRCRWLSVAFIMVLFLKNLMIGAWYIGFSFKQSLTVAGQLATLRSAADPVSHRLQRLPRHLLSV